MWRWAGCWSAQPSLAPLRPHHQLDFRLCWHVAQPSDGIHDSSWKAKNRLTGNVAESGITDPQEIAAFEGTRALVAVPIAENKLSVYARQYVDLYALLIPYRVTVVDQTVQPTLSSTSRAVQSKAQDWHVVSIENHITESNEIYTGYSWKLIIRNDSAAPAVFDGWVEFQDADGFMLADDAVNLDRSISIAPASEGVFTGLRYIENTKRVARTVAKIVKR